MLSTKNIQTSNSYGPGKTLSLGNHLVNIRGLEYQEAKYETNGRPDVNISVLLEGPDQGQDFEGMPRDWDNPEKGRYKGQFAKVKISPFNFGDRVSGGKQRDRDADALSALTRLAIELGVRDAVDEIAAQTLEELVNASSHIFANANNKLNVLIGAKEYYVEKDGELNKRYERYFPMTAKGFFAYSSEEKADKVETYDAGKHIYLPDNQKQKMAQFKNGTVGQTSGEIAENIDWGLG